MNDSLVHWAGGTITFSACFSSNFGSSPQILHPTQVDEPVPIPGAAWGNPQPQACPGAMPSVSPFSSRQDLCSSQKYLLFWAFSLSVCCLKGAWQNSLFLQGLAFSVIFFFFLIPTIESDSCLHLLDIFLGGGRRLDFPHHSFWHVVLCTAEALWGLKLIFIHFHTSTCALYTVLQITGNLSVY